MPQASHPFVYALAGGVLIGLASLLVLLATGTIPGISGILSRALRLRSGDIAWRLVFLVGLVAGAALAFSWVESAAVFRSVRSLVAMGVAGVLVGFGTRVGGGCTSGHGVCGIGLGSKASFVATLVFMLAGMATVFVLQYTRLGFAP